MTVKKNEKGRESIKIDFQGIKQSLDAAENQIKFAKQLLFNGLYVEKAKKLNKTDEMVVEGIFDGQCMIDNTGKSYAVPPNYASKSKLIPGDILKLTIGTDGDYTFKQIELVERRRLTGILIKQDGKYYIQGEGKTFQVLGASISFFKAKENDKISLLIPKYQESLWGAMDKVINE